MMNTLRRKTFLRQQSRPSLLSFNKQEHEQQEHEQPSSLSPECSEPLRSLQDAALYHQNNNTSNNNYNTSYDNMPLTAAYDHHTYNKSSNKKSRYESSPNHYRNQHLGDSCAYQDSEYGFSSVKKQTKHRHTNITANEDHSGYCYSPARTPYDRQEVPLYSPPDHTHTNYYNDSRYDQEQLYPHPAPADSCDNRKTTAAADPRKRPSASGSVLKKQSSFRQCLGYQVHNSSGCGGVVASTSGPAGAVMTRSVGGVVKRRKHVVLLGLDGSGKTTILLRLKFRCYIATTPTVGFNHEKVWGGGFRWSAWDVGGGERVRPLWATYTRGTDAIVFVVDASANSDTMEEARLELVRIVKLSKCTALQLHKPAPPLLVLANFQDRSMARNAPEVAKCLSLPQEGAAPTAGGNCVAAPCWAVACVCGITGEGLDEGMATLRHLLDQGGATNSRTKNRALDRWR